MKWKFVSLLFLHIRPTTSLSTRILNLGWCQALSLEKCLHDSIVTEGKHVTRFMFMCLPTKVQSLCHSLVQTVRQKGQTVLFLSALMYPKGIGRQFFSCTEKKYPVRKKGHTNACFVSLVSWGSCFDPAVTWNNHIEDKSPVIIIHEDLKGVKQMLFTDSQNTSEPISWNLLKLGGNGTGFWKSKIKLILVTSWVQLYRSRAPENRNATQKIVNEIRRGWWCSSQVGNSFI